VAVKSHRPGRQGIEGRRSDITHFPVSAHVVLAEGVRNYPDDVHNVFPILNDISQMEFIAFINVPFWGGRFKPVVPKKTNFFTVLSLLLALIY